MRHSKPRRNAAFMRQNWAFEETCRAPAQPAPIFSPFIHSREPIAKFVLCRQPPPPNPCFSESASVAYLQCRCFFPIRENPRNPWLKFPQPCGSFRPHDFVRNDFVDSRTWLPLRCSMLFAPDHVSGPTNYRAAVMGAEKQNRIQDKRWPGRRLACPAREKGLGGVHFFRFD
jgi:hypothetical protein